MLNYYLTPNRISSDPDDYMAISSNGESFTIEDVYDHMTRQGSTLTKAEALAAFEEITQGILNIVEQGSSVVTPLLNIKPTLSGVFTDEDDRFDAARHEVRINVSPGIRLRDVAPNISPKKIAARERQPELAHYYDNTLDQQDDGATPDGGARISGTLLKFDESDATQGIFFVNVADNSETRIDAPLLRNMPSELIFMNPTLAAGTYRLEVRSLLEGNSDIKSGTLSEELTVA